MIDDQELRAIQFLAERVRKATSGAAPWDTAGLVANLRKLATRNLHMTIEHVMRHAADPAAKTPGVLAGSYTPDAPTSSGTAHPLKAQEQCRRCGGPKGNCACTREHLAAVDNEPIEILPAAEAIRLARAAAKPTKEQP